MLRQHKALVNIFSFNSEQHNGNLDDAILEIVLESANLRSNGAVGLKLAMVIFPLTFCWYQPFCSIGLE